MSTALGSVRTKSSPANQTHTHPHTLVQLILTAILPGEDWLASCPWLFISIYSEPVHPLGQNNTSHILFNTIPSCPTQSLTQEKGTVWRGGDGGEGRGVKEKYLIPWKGDWFRVCVAGCHHPVVKTFTGPPPTNSSGALWRQYQSVPNTCFYPSIPIHWRRNERCGLPPTSLTAPSCWVVNERTLLLHYWIHAHQYCRLYQLLGLNAHSMRQTLPAWSLPFHGFGQATLCKSSLVRFLFCRRHQ